MWPLQQIVTLLGESCLQGGVLRMRFAPHTAKTNSGEYLAGRPARPSSPWMKSRCPLHSSTCSSSTSWQRVTSLGLLGCKQACRRAIRKAKARRQSESKQNRTVRRLPPAWQKQHRMCKKNRLVLAGSERVVGSHCSLPGLAKDRCRLDYLHAGPMGPMAHTAMASTC